MRYSLAVPVTALSLLAAASTAQAGTVYVSPSGSDSSPCTAGAPCQTFNRAYRAASPGDVVQVAAGSYGGQTIAADGSKSSGAKVVFAPAPGAAVSTGDLHVAAHGVEVRGMRSSSTETDPGASGVVFRNMASRGLFISGGSNIAVIGGSVGPGDSYDSQITASGSEVPTNILIDGVDFHDWTRRSDPSAHIECLQFGAGVNVTIRRSKFRNCETQGLFIRSWGGGSRIGNFVIENNFFDRTTVGYYPLKVGLTDGQTYNGLTVRNNSSLQPLEVDPGAASHVAFIANVAPNSACVRGATYSHNVWDGTTCGATDIDAPSGFVDPASTNLHLRTGVAAVDAGDPANHPATDIDGQPRGSRPDAGADESNPPSAPPPPAGTPGGGSGGGKAHGKHRHRHHVTLHVKRLGHGKLRVRGRVRPAHGGHVRVAVRRHRHGGHWRKVHVKRVHLRHHGHYRTKLHLRHKRHYRIRVKYVRKGHHRHKVWHSHVRRLRA